MPSSSNDAIRTMDDAATEIERLREGAKGALVIVKHAAARLTELEAKVERWHRAAMRAGVVVCTNGGLIFSETDRANVGYPASEVEAHQNDSVLKSCTKVDRSTP